MLNHITIMGRLTGDPELRRTGNGTAVASFTVACDRDFGGQDGQKETDFINCVAWRQTGEFVSRYFTKGRMIVVDGRLQIRKYTDKNGNNRTAAEVVADQCYFGDSKREDGNQGGYTASSGGYMPPVNYPVNRPENNDYGTGGQYGGYGGGYSASAASDSGYSMREDDNGDLPF